MKKIIIASTLLLAMTSVAYAQSTVTGTLSSGASANNTGSSSLNGTVANGNSLTGTVTSPSNTSTSGGGGGGSNGPPVSSGGGSGSNVIDICPNIAGDQTILPAGFVLQNGNCVASPTTQVAGETATSPTTTTTPGVPNTGAGGDAPATVPSLFVSALIALGGLIYLRARPVV